MDNRTIDASPSKVFFIQMLTRDIPVVSAITELVDNSIDGATRNRTTNNYKGFEIHINFNSEYFTIRDNCGGISVETAETYAFKFGKPEEEAKDEQTIGRFGVGMKRALFRLGDHFYIKSITTESRFSFDVNVKEWSKDPVWKFGFQEKEEGINVNKDKTGTEITVKNLHNKSQFELESFENQVKQEIRSKVGQKIDQGLKIFVNEIPLTNNNFDIIFTDKLKPSFFEEVHNGVNVRIIAGLGEREPKKAGWYIFCNDRLILEAEKSFITGWGDEHSLYHNDVAWFRGYVFFESTDALLLPWNTTKTGIDIENEVFRFARTQMLVMMKVITRFLKKVSEQSDDGDDSVKNYINISKTKKINDVNFKLLKIAPVLPDLFSAPPKERRISYLVSTEKIKKVQDITGINTLKEIGEYTFDYFLAMECGD